MFEGYTLATGIFGLCVVGYQWQRIAGLARELRETHEALLRLARLNETMTRERDLGEDTGDE